MVPRNIQLQAALASLAGYDSKLISGTGTGKTLTIALPHLLQPDRVSLVVSPLKHLQVTQVRVSTHLPIFVIESSGRSRHSKDGG
jgi:superfamily II DNA/RNA helicase